MPHLFIILLKINLVLLLFAVTYYLVLRRLTFYTLNRCFLVLGIVFSTAYPFIDLTDFFHRQEVNQSVITYLPQLNQKAADLVPSGFFINNWPILSALFYFGVLLMTVRLAIQFISLYKIHRKSNPGKVANYSVRLLNDSVGPFSFWQTVYVNPKLHNENELHTILEHEMVHVKQWHSLDIILSELSVVFYWFNPGVWLMKKAVKENLEFITDQNILKKGMDKKVYQYSLLGVGQLNASAAIVNNFNLLDLKKRIKMMNAKRSSKLTLSRYAFVLPVLLITTLAFTVSKKDVKAHLPQLAKIIPQLKIEEEKSKEITITKPKKRKEAGSEVQKIVDKKDTIYHINNFIDAVFVKKDSASGPGTFKEIEEFMANVKEKVKLPFDWKSVENAKVTQFFLYKKDSVDTEKIGQQRRVSITVKTVGKFEEGKIPFPGKDKVIMIRAVKARDTLLAADKIEYLVNGKVYLSNELNKLDPTEIQYVQVIKGTGDRPQIHIETKRKAEL